MLRTYQLLFWKLHQIIEIIAFSSNVRQLIFSVAIILFLARQDGGSVIKCIYASGLFMPNYEEQHIHPILTIYNQSLRTFNRVFNPQNV